MDRAVEVNRVAIIGAGTIGSAVAMALRPHFQVMVTRRRGGIPTELLEAGVEEGGANQEAASWADVVILAVKPYQVLEVMSQISEVAPEAAPKVVVSLAAAMTIQMMEAVCPFPVVRAMTNTACRIRRGYTVYSNGLAVGEEEEAVVRSVFRSMGAFEKVDEQYLDVLTAMSGSGPAYMYTVLEAMILGALKAGLPRDLALRAAANTAIGASSLLLESGGHPAELRDQVITPGGVTIEGLYELEEGRVRTAFMRAVSAAALRSVELADSARRSAMDKGILAMQVKER
ncbi:pyrroline-5-carboxylate reductase [Thermanaerovibrio velox DSM 12556]|uniref:Pyrroline-5-carboxylate reductase n=1 Tax=Thermanaerovibrio velox DSM 12556 TaxID=926567 RepID=H0UN73_9BACT|nr:pyrroline-5-carboxylate reductase [Thermanaerovibrio velox]EHM10358.1 pyrroline-5-carboxylate reductase [Thermanaerovibrio velox DSM 12556]